MVMEGVKKACAEMLRRVIPTDKLIKFGDNFIIRQRVSMSCVTSIVR